MVDIPACHSDGLWPGAQGFCMEWSHSWEEMRPGPHSQTWVLPSHDTRHQDFDFSPPDLINILWVKGKKVYEVLF